MPPAAAPLPRSGRKRTQPEDPIAEEEDEEGEVPEADAQDAAEEWDNDEEGDGVEDDEGGVQGEAETQHHKAGAGTKSDGDKYHTVVTVSDGLYVQWQARMVSSAQQ